MYPRVIVKYSSGVHKGEYEGYVLQDMGKDALVLWTKDNTINVVEKKIVEYTSDDLLIDLRKSICNNTEAVRNNTEAVQKLQDTVNTLQNQVSKAKTDFVEFKNYVMEYIKEEEANRKAIIAVLEQLKRNNSYEESPKRRKLGI